MVESQPQLPQEGLQEKIQISISCRNLVDLDVFTVSDPVVHVYMKNSSKDNYFLVGKTEEIDNNLNPDFTTTFTLDYHFEKQQYLKFCVYDVDSKVMNHIGDCETTISRIMGAKKQTFLSDLNLPGKNQSRGQIIVKADSVKSSNDEISFIASANLIQRYGGFCCGADNPYLLIKRSRGGDDTAQEFVRVYQTPNQPGTARPQFGRDPLVIKLQQMCNSDKERQVKFEIINYVGLGTHQIYGSTIVTVNQLLQTPNQVFDLQNDQGQNVGQLNLQQIQIIEKPSFVDYLRSGWNINLSVAIDFTASNGAIIKPTSLHRQYNNGQFNDYENAIQSVGQILEPYSFNRRFAAFGFGGIPKFAGGNKVSHCFNLTGSQDPTVEGLPNLFNSYKTAIQGTQLDGPTYFSEILIAVRDYMKANISNPMYHILLILTDGVIHDMVQTKDLIVECSKFPLSIIIVGIGHADFQDMIELDGDDNVLRNSRGEATQRDIVQFVQFKDFSDNQDLSQLAEEVLKEVPDQLCGYMMQKKIKPVIRPLMTQKSIDNEYNKNI